MTSEFFCEEIMEFINGTTGIQPPTNCSILSSTPSATFSSTPSVSLPASTAATLSSTSSSSTASHLQIIPLLLLPSLLFPPQLTLLCYLENIMEFINSTTGIQPPTNCSIISSPSATFSCTPYVIVFLFQLTPSVIVFLLQLPLLCHLLLVLLPQATYKLFHYFYSLHYSSRLN